MPDADTEPHPDSGAAVVDPYVAQIHEHQQIQWVEGVQVRVLLDAATTDGQLAVVEEVSTQPHATPLHLHPGDDQSFIVLEGSLRVWVGDDRYDVDAGGIAFLPRGVPHAVRATSPRTRLLVVGTPAGEEELFRRAGWDLSQPLPAEWTLAPEQIAQAAASIGHRILVPPPTD
jgi:quercetin dioxygenase-like cupin family protein